MPGKREREEVRRDQILRAAFEVAASGGIEGLTIRAVAAEARLSHTLVLFHFGTRESLVDELLEWLIGNTSVLHLSPEVSAIPRALDRLEVVLQQEMTRLSQQPRHIRLFYEFWTLGARRESIRVRISAELERYRSAFRVIMEEMLLAESVRFGGVTADGLAAMAVSWINGCAVQAMIDPDHFDTDEYLAAVRGTIQQLA
jgi:TetR/AcrR family transcriptional regulator, transcriptional repressor of bet genes